MKWHIHTRYPMASLWDTDGHQIITTDHWNSVISKQTERKNTPGVKMKWLGYLGTGKKTQTWTHQKYKEQHIQKQNCTQEQNNTPKITLINISPRETWKSKALI